MVGGREGSGLLHAPQWGECFPAGGFLISRANWSRVRLNASVLATAVNEGLLA